MEKNERAQIIDAYDRIEDGTPEYKRTMGDGSRWEVTKDVNGNIICVDRNNRNNVVTITKAEAGRGGGRRRRRRRTRRSRGSKKRSSRRHRRSRRHH